MFLRFTRARASPQRQIMTLTLNFSGYDGTHSFTHAHIHTTTPHLRAYRTVSSCVRAVYAACFNLYFSFMVFALDQTPPGRHQPTKPSSRALAHRPPTNPWKTPPRSFGPPKEIYSSARESSRVCFVFAIIVVVKEWK